MLPNGREFSGTRAWVERTACRPGNPRRGPWSGRVNGLSQRPKGHAPRLQIVQEADQVTQATGLAGRVSRPERVAFRERLEALGQFRPFDMRPGCFIDKYSLESLMCQYRKLQVWVLVIGLDPRIAYFMTLFCP